MGPPLISANNPQRDENYILRIHIICARQATEGTEFGDGWVAGVLTGERGRWRTLTLACEGFGRSLTAGTERGGGK